MNLPGSRYRIIILALAAWISLLSCKDEYISSVREVESNGVSIRLSGWLNKDFAAGIGGGGHTGLIIPVAGQLKDIGLSVAVQGRDSIDIFNDHYTIFGSVGKEDLERLMESAEVTLSPDGYHLLYVNTGKDFADTAIVHYLDKKFPFFSGYYDSRILSADQPDWSLLPEPVAIAKKIMHDTIKDNSLHAYLWNIILSSPEEMEADLICIELLGEHPLATKRVLELSEKNKASNKWKIALRTKAAELPALLLSDKTTDEFIFDFETLAMKSGDEVIENIFAKFIIQNLRNRALVRVIQGDYSKAFLRKHRNEIMQRFKGLDTVSGYNAGILYRVAEIMKLSGQKSKCMELMVNAWPELPENSRGWGTVIDDAFNELTESQKKILWNKAEAILKSNAYPYAASGYFTSNYSCDVVGQLARKYPGKIDVAISGCDTSTAK